MNLGTENIIGKETLFLPNLENRRNDATTPTRRAGLTLLEGLRACRETPPQSFALNGNSCTEPILPTTSSMKADTAKGRYRLLG